jgi:AmmeMemoRadiSam system protein B
MIMKQVRYPQVAGAFYPASKEAIEKMLRQYFSSDPPTRKLEISCIVAPHAGYIYSGEIAAKAYRLLSGQNFETVIVISPSHYDYFEGCSIYPGNYKTAFGEIETDTVFAEHLIDQNDFINISTIGHTKEHALEVQLPFLQYVLESFKLVPIVMGKQSNASATQLAHLITNTLEQDAFTDKRVLIVSSSDLSHFYDAKHARKLDDVIVSDIASLDDEKLDTDILQKKGEACGYGPILTGIKASKMLGATQCKITGYGTSGDVNHDYSKVVGYVSAAIYRN